MAVNGKTYLLMQDEAETKRLDQQHYLFKQSLGYGTVANPQVPIEQLHRVLEIGTGTGVWLNELFEEGAHGRHVPEDAKGQGWDISLDKITPPSKANKRLTFSLKNILDEPGVEAGTFDLVHVRLLVLGLSPEQYRTAMKHCFALLKPGGYLQVCETDDIYKPLDEAEPDETFTRLRKVYDTAGSTNKQNGTELVNGMLPAIKGAGFEVVSIEDQDLPVGPAAAAKLSNPKEVGQGWAAVTQHCIVSLKDSFLAAGGQPGLNSEKQFDDFIKVSEHFHANEGYFTLSKVITARKPV